MTANRSAATHGIDRPGPAGSITVAGCGNWLIGADRIGPRVMTMVDGRWGERVTTCDIGTGALALLDHLESQDLLVVVDACVGHGTPGEVLELEPGLDIGLTRGTSAHQIGPAEALTVGRHLYPELMPRRVLFLLVETDGLTDELEDAACEQVVRILDREIGPPGDRAAATAGGSRSEEGRTPWQNKLICNESRA